MALKKKKQRIMHLVMASAHAALVGCGSMYHVIQKLPGGKFLYHMIFCNGILSFSVSNVQASIPKE